MQHMNAGAGVTTDSQLVCASCHNLFHSLPHLLQRVRAKKDEPGTVEHEVFERVRPAGDEMRGYVYKGITVISSRGACGCSPPAVPTGISHSNACRCLLVLPAHMMHP